jgi:hypothetical protein
MGRWDSSGAQNAPAIRRSSSGGPNGRESAHPNKIGHPSGDLHAAPFDDPAHDRRNNPTKFKQSYASRLKVSSEKFQSSVYVDSIPYAVGATCLCLTATCWLRGAYWMLAGSGSAEPSARGSEAPKLMPRLES